MTTLWTWSYLASDQSSEFWGSIKYITSLAIVLTDNSATWNSFLVW